MSKSLTAEYESPSRRSRGSILVALLLALSALAGCDGTGGSTTSSSEASAGPKTIPYDIVTTIGMISDITTVVSDGRANVTGLLKAGIDPHLYSPTRSDVERLLESDVIFYNGLLLEGKMSDTLIRAASKRPVFAVTELIDQSRLLAHEDYEGHSDPHVWMDPKLWKLAVAVVRDRLIEFDPEGRDVYERNADAYTQKIDALDDYATKTLMTVPVEQRVLVSAHDAFQYFGRRFGYEVVGIQGLSTESEAGVRDIERLVKLLVERRVRAVFVESTVSEKNVQALIAGAKARGHEVVIGGELFSDAMGESGTYEGTYLGMIDHNVTTIARALGGEAPERGLDGKLAP